MDREWLIEALCSPRDRVQMASMANALTEMADFRMVDTASRAVHVGIRNLHLQTAKVILGQSDLGQMERLITEIPVMADSLFGS